MVLFDTADAVLEMWASLRDDWVMVGAIVECLGCHLITLF